MHKATLAGLGIGQGNIDGVFVKWGLYLQTNQIPYNLLDANIIYFKVIQDAKYLCTFPLSI